MNYCSRCGSTIPPGSLNCPRCGMRQRSTGAGINNIFTALMRERTPGVIMEFSLWCTVCVVVLMSLIATIVGHGNITWILLLIFSIGLGVLMAFRLKPISMLYSVGVFNLLILIVHYACFAKSKTYMGYDGSYYNLDYSTAGYSPLNITLFIIAIVLSVALLVCGFVYNFTRVKIENLLTIMELTTCGITLLLSILMYAAPGLGTGMSAVGINYYNSALRFFLNYRGYWIGTVSYWCILIVVMLHYIFFFWGAMGTGARRIIEIGKRTYQTPPARSGYGSLRGVCGIYAGREIPLNGGTITIGSSSEVQIRIHDHSVSRRHCAIRFNRVSGLYEVQDISTNGVFLNNGTRLQKGVFNPVARGSIICIGSQSQQFRLM